MKTVLRICVLVLFVVVALDTRVDGAFFNREFYPGDNLFHTTFLRAGEDSLSTVLPKVPEGTTVSLWSPTLNAYGTTAQFLGGVWSTNVALPAGTGAKLNTATRFTVTFVGAAANHDGSLWDGNTAFVPPPVFSSPAGVYLLGDKTAMRSTGNDVFVNVLGRDPVLGERFTRLDAQTHTHITSTSRGDGTWDILPVLEISEAGFFQVVVESAPTLRIAAAAALQAVIAWPANAVGFTLEMAFSPSALAWSPVTNAPAILGNELTVTIPATDAQRCFRLHRP